MTAALPWPDVLLRLGLALVAGLLIGLDRGEHAHPAGLRTTMLIATAACLAMTQANWLAAESSVFSNHAVRLSVLRIPEGILSGVGFIGAGAILRRGDVVRGITSAATIWLVTVIGLCFGGGQLWLGAVGTAAALLTLWLMKWAEAMFVSGRRGRLVVTFGEAGPHEAVLLRILNAHGFELRGREVERTPDGATCFTCTGRYRGAFPAWSSALLQEIATRPDVRRVVWSDID